MRNTEGRRLKLFYELSDEKFHTLDDLADELDVSKRTIFLDIKEIEPFIERAKAKLIIKKGIGYKLEPEDREAFRDAVDRVKSRFIFNSAQNKKDENYVRFYDIIALTLCSDCYLTNEQISERLYLAKSSIQMEFAIAQYVLDTYDLTINRQDKNGQMILGDELKIRLCGLQLNEYYSGISVFDEMMPVKEPFFFKSDRGKAFQKYRRIVNGVVQNHPYGFSSPMFLKCIKYLTIAEERCLTGHPIKLEESEKQFLKGFPQYKMAKEVLANTEPFWGNEEEICGLALIFLLLGSPDSALPNESLYGTMYPEARKLAGDILLMFSEKYDMSDKYQEENQEIIASYLVIILIAIRFSCARGFCYPIKNDQNGYFTNLLCSRLAYDACTYINQTYKTEISLYYFGLLHEAMCACLNRIPYKKKPLRAVVSSVNGIENCRIIGKRIEAMLPKRVDVEWIPEALGFFSSGNETHRDCDFAVCHDPGLRYRSDFPMFSVHIVPRERELEAIEDFVLWNQFALHEMWNAAIPPATVFDHYEITSMEAFMDIIANKYVADEEKIPYMQVKLLEYAQYCANSRLSFMFIERDDTKEDIFDIYRLDKNFKWGFEEVKYVVIMSVKFGRNNKLMRLVSDFAYVIMAYPEIMEQMIEEGSPDPVLKKILKIILA